MRAAKPKFRSVTIEAISASNYPPDHCNEPQLLFQSSLTFIGAVTRVGPFVNPQRAQKSLYTMASNAGRYLSRQASTGSTDA